MDSKVVSKAIRERIRPLLKENGFTEFTDRNAWRYFEDRIDVVNFQSYNQYHSDVMGCTTFSYSVNLGVFLKYLPRDFNIKEKNGFLFPMEYECHFRAELKRGYREWFKKIDALWYIDKRGKNLDKAIKDTSSQLNKCAFTWFNIFNDDKDILLLLQDELKPQTKTWGYGANPSPNRAFLKGYISYRLGNKKDAKSDLNSALSSGCYDGIKKDIEQVIEKL